MNDSHLTLVKSSKKSLGMLKHLTSVSLVLAVALLMSNQTAIAQDVQHHGPRNVAPDTRPPKVPGNSSKPSSPLDEALDQALSPPHSQTPTTQARGGNDDSNRDGSISAKERMTSGGVIRNFIDSWGLFHESYLTGWCIAVVLSVVGVLVVARDQIFIGAALSQASALGVAAALLIGTISGGATGGADAMTGPLTSVMAVAFSVVAALLTARGGAIAPHRESHEAITGWIFLVSASLSVLIISRSPHGLEEIQRLASSSLIGATTFDVWVFAGLAAMSVAVIALFSRRILLLTTDPTMAAAVGIRTGWWATGIAAWLGVAVGLSIRVSGVLFTFGLLVLPALVAKNICRQVRPMFIASPAVALAASMGGFVLANHYDFPPAQMTVAVLALFLPIVWLLRLLFAR